MNLRRTFALSGLALVLAGSTSAQTDPDVVSRIIEEGKNNSRVWQTLLHISETIGPRLTGSTRLQHANMWSRDEFSRYGLTNCELQRWGDIPVGFDRGPSSVTVLTPEVAELEFTSRSWSAGTDGPVTGPVIAMPTSREELEGLGGRLEGAWILTESSRRRRPPSDESDEDRAAREEMEAVNAEVREMPIAGILVGSRNDQVTTGGVRGWRELSYDDLPDDVEVSLRRTDFDRIEEWLGAGEEVSLRVDLDHSFLEGPIPVYNTVAEIPGTEIPEEVVIFSAHLDSWDGPGSMGTQDNGTGSSVMIETARILADAGVKPRRTIRFCLWTGEEQGLLGSRAYVEALSEEERSRISAAFVDDGGTNYQGGLVCIESMLPMLDEAIAPAKDAFPDYEILNVVQEEMPKGGSSDHASFNRAGIPGFFWIEKGKGGREGKDYRFVWHTQNDTPRYAVEEYLVQSATTSALVAYYLANAETLLPRELPAEEEAVVEEFDPVPSPISGRWLIRLVGDDAPDFGFDLDLMVDGEAQVRGEMSSAMGDSRVREGSWDAETSSASFKVSGRRGVTEFEVRLEEGALEGSMARADRDPWRIRGTRPPSVDSPISGTWNAVLTERGSSFRMNFQVSEDGVVTGWLKSSQTDSELFDGRWDPETSTVTFEYDYPHAGRLAVSAKVDGDSLKGTIGESAVFEASRSSDEESGEGE